MLNYSEETITLSTFPVDDKYYSKEFTILTSYARELIAKYFGQTLEKFLDEYIWDWTCDWPDLAEMEGQLISTRNVE